MSYIPSSESTADLFADVILREQALLDASQRADSDFVTRQLHGQFVEYGASGRIWHRGAIVAELTANPATTGTASDFEAARLSADVVLVTYRVDGAVSSLRSSVWVRGLDNDWKLRFHQGTSTESLP